MIRTPIGSPHLLFSHRPIAQHVFWHIFVSSSWIIYNDPITNAYRSTVDPNTPNLHPVTDRPASELYGPLEEHDLDWVCAGGFSTETHIWYQVLEDGTFLLCQVIHSAVG